MAALATVADLEDYLQVDLDATDELRATTLLDLASGLIRRVAGQTFDQVADDQVTLEATYTNRLLLPQLPVTAISSVVTNSVTLTENLHYETVLPAGIIRRLSTGRWNYPTTVTYTHGYATIPDDLRAICVEMAARAWVNPRGLQSEQIGNYSARWGSTGVTGIGLDEMEEKVIMSYRAVPGY